MERFWRRVPSRGVIGMVAVSELRGALERGDALAAALAEAERERDRLIEVAHAWRSVREYSEEYRERVGMPTDADGLAQLAAVVEAEADAADELLAALAAVRVSAETEGAKE
jgi:hypothetical protein